MSDDPVGDWEAQRQRVEEHIATKRDAALLEIRAAITDELGILSAEKLAEYLHAQKKEIDDVLYRNGCWK